MLRIDIGLDLVAAINEIKTFQIIRAMRVVAFPYTRRPKFRREMIGVHTVLIEFIFSYSGKPHKPRRFARVYERAY